MPNNGKRISELPFIAEVGDLDTLLIVDQSIFDEQYRRVQVNQLIPDCDATTKGRIRLTNDLGGTANNPTVPLLHTKAPIDSPEFTGIPLAPTPSGINLGQLANVDFVQTSINITAGQVNASSYGAIGNLVYSTVAYNRVDYISGVDDTAAIQAALNAAGELVSSDNSKDTEGNVICFIDKGNYQITNTLVVPPNVVIHCEGWLFNFITDAHKPVIQGSPHSHVRKLQVHANNKSGLTWGTNGTTNRYSSYLETIVVWHAGVDYKSTRPLYEQKCGLRLHGKDFRLGHVWIKGGYVGLELRGAQDVSASNIFLSNSSTGLLLNSCDQVNFSAIIWDTVSSRAAAVEASNNISIKGQAYVHSDVKGTPMKTGVAVDNSSNVQVEYTAQSTGGNGLEIDDCKDSTFKLNLSNTRGSNQTSGVGTATSHWIPNGSGALQAHNIGVDYSYNGTTATEAPGAAIIYGSNLSGYINIELIKSAGIATAIGTPYGSLKEVVTDTTSFNKLTLASALPITSGGTGSQTKNFVDLSTNQTIEGVKSFTGSSLLLANSTSPLLQYAAVGTGIPSFTTRSAGTKIVLSPAIGATTTDYAIGLGTNLFWNSVPTASNNFAWYAATTELMRLQGDGKLGLGTSTPGARLQLVGGAVITNTSTAVTDPGAGNLSVSGNATVGGNLIVTGTIVGTGDFVNLNTNQTLAATKTFSGILRANGATATLTETALGVTRLDLGKGSTINAPQLILEHAPSSTVWHLDNNAGLLRWFTGAGSQLAVNTAGNISINQSDNSLATTNAVRLQVIGGVAITSTNANVVDPGAGNMVISGNLTVNGTLVTTTVVEGESNSVNLTTNQAIGGIKTFDSPIAIGKNTTPLGSIDIQGTNTGPEDTPQIHLGQTNSSVTLVAFDGGTSGTDSFLDINNIPTSSSGSLYVRLFRNTTTSGPANFIIHRANSSSATNAQLSGTGNSFTNNSIGNFGVGTNTPGAKLQVAGSMAITSGTAAVATAPASGSLSVAGTITSGGTIATTENSTVVATTAYVKAQNYETALGFTPVQQGGTANFTSEKVYLGWNNTDTKAKIQVDAVLIGSIALESWVTTNFANKTSPSIINATITTATISDATLTGTPVAPTPTTTNNSTRIATTAYVKAQNYQASLGYIPIQQGGGTGQNAANKIYLGNSSGTFLKAQIDTTDLGNLITQNYEGGMVALSNNLSNLISFKDAAGLAFPSFTTRSTGTKISLAGTIDATNVEYGIGIAPSTLWNSIPQANSTFKFSWYGGTQELLTLRGDGILYHWGGQLQLNNTTSNLITYTVNGTGTPSFTTRSAGTKIVFNPQLSATSVDYAIGRANNVYWQSIPTPTTSQKFSWYGGTTEIMSLNGGGNVSITGAVNISSGALNLTNTTFNLITYTTQGNATPTFTSRSAGTKIVLYPEVAATAVDYAIGIAANIFWQSIPQAISGNKFSWYAGTSEIMSLNGTGQLTAGAGVYTGDPAADETSSRVATTNWVINKRAFVYASASVNIPHGSITQLGNVWTGHKQQGSVSVLGSPNNYIRLNSNGWWRITYDFNLTPAADYIHVLFYFEKLNAAGNGWEPLITPYQSNLNGTAFPNPYTAGSFVIPITWSGQDKVVSWRFQQNNNATATRVLNFNCAAELICP